jgi:subtilase family serine protease
MNASSCQVATQGWNFEIYDGGELGLVGGTSASSPTFASIIAIINDRLGAFGRPPLGFLNRMCTHRIVRATADAFECSVSVPVRWPGWRVQRRHEWQERRL